MCVRVRDKFNTWPQGTKPATLFGNIIKVIIILRAFSLSLSLSLSLSPGSYIIKCGSLQVDMQVRKAQVLVLGRANTVIGI